MIRNLLAWLDLIVRMSLSVNPLGTVLVVVLVILAAIALGWWIW